VGGNPSTSIKEKKTWGIIQVELEKKKKKIISNTFNLRSRFRPQTKEKKEGKEKHIELNEGGRNGQREKGKVFALPGKAAPEVPLQWNGRQVIAVEGWRKKTEQIWTPTPTAGDTVMEK